MKPEKLVICGWGPYKEETVIDFSKLDMSGLFLITGQTGAGKTTIFDAIAYALYGVMSGGMREKGSVRSDFADAETKTYVELYMQHKNQKYHICRNPEYLRPKKRKSGENAFTKEKENAVLTMPDGTIIAGNQDVTDKIKELLCMDAKQFCQISMIAQGEFAKLLFAPSAEKNAIFRELFGTGIYEKVQGELKRRSTVLYDEYRQYKNKMEEDVRLLSLSEEEWENLTSAENLNFEAIGEYLNARLTTEQKKAEQMKQTEEKLESEILALQREMEIVHQQNLRFKEAQEAAKKVSELEEKQEWAKYLKDRISDAQRVSVLMLEEKVILDREKEVVEASKHIEALDREMREAQRQIELLKETVIHKDDLQEAYELWDKLEELKEKSVQETQRLMQMQMNLSIARADYEKAQAVAEEKIRVYEQADVRYKKAVIGIAARLVKEGEPCPVCGSLEHPQIAQISEDIPEERQLEEWKIQAESAREHAKHLYEKAFALVNEEKQCAQGVKDINVNVENFNQKLQDRPAFILEYIQGHTRSVFEEECAHFVELDTLLKEKEKHINWEKELLYQKQKTVEKDRKSFEYKISECGFTDREEYEKALGLAENLEQMQNDYESYQKEYSSARKLQTHLETVLAGVELVDEAVLQEKFKQKLQVRREYREETEGIRILVNQIYHCIEGINKNQKSIEKISREYGIVKDLDDLANGNNARRLVFEQFVLAGYFEKVLRAANLRLEKMTDGRYELWRARQISDGRKKDNLEIMVMDYYTGRQRSVKTLSGGETFKASLALALGMSDCIQAENGGMEVETLFIDEGFGALDEESLDQACDTLMMLAGKDRMVGIISHVAQLREKIEHQIIVEKHNNGSRARVI